MALSPPQAARAAEFHARARAASAATSAPLATAADTVTRVVRALYDAHTLLDGLPLLVRMTALGHAVTAARILPVSLSGGLCRLLAMADVSLEHATKCEWVARAVGDGRGGVDPALLRKVYPWWPDAFMETKSRLYWDARRAVTVNGHTVAVRTGVRPAGANP